MKAAFLETTGGPDVIRYGDLPTPEPKAGEVLRPGRRRRRQPDRHLHPRRHRRRCRCRSRSSPAATSPAPSRRSGRASSASRPATASGARNQGLLGRQGTFAEYACVARGLALPDAGRRRRRARPPRSALVGITAHLGLFRVRRSAGRARRCSSTAAPAASARWSCRWPRRSAPRSSPRSARPRRRSCASSWGADCVAQLQDRRRRRRRCSEFTGGKGVNVWYETQREPDFVTTVDLMAPRGRIVVMAGRQAQPVFPVGPFYVKGLSLFGFAMFNATPDEQRRCADDINRWLAEKKLRTLPSARRFPWRRRPRPIGCRKRTRCTRRAR